MSSELIILVGCALVVFLGLGVVLLFKRSSKTELVDPEEQPGLEEPDEAEDDEKLLRRARAACLRGDYQEAIEHYKGFAAVDRYNRLPWVEIARIQHDNLNDPRLAVETLTNALEGQDWPINDAGYFMIRLAELHWQDLGDNRTSATILNQVIECFPDTKHSANAVRLLREMKAPVSR